MYKKIIFYTTLCLLQTNLHAEIKEVSLIGGMVCTACITPMQNVLKKVRGVEGTPNIDLVKGTATITLQKNNNTTLAALKKHLTKTVGESTYSLKEIKHVIATGKVKKEEDSYLFEVSGSQDEIYLNDTHAKKKLSKKQLKKLNNYQTKESLVTLKATIHQHADGSWGIDDPNNIDLSE